MIDGEPLNDRDMMGYYIILAAAGHDTTSASTAGAMLALARDPEQWARVRADRSLLPGIVEEAIRWTTPVQHFMRTAAEDTEVGGQAIAKGDWLMMNYVAANHDPAHFDDPRRFDAARKPKHLAPAPMARRRGQGGEALERLTHDVQPAVTHLGPARLDDVVDRLQVVLHLGVAVDRDAPLLAIPHEPRGDAWILWVRDAEGDVRRQDDAGDALAAVPAEGLQRLADIVERDRQRRLKLRRRWPFGAGEAVRPL